jgi:hypothetical protein
MGFVCVVQSDDEMEQVQATFSRSRLLSGLTPNMIHDMAMLAATFGPIVQIDGRNPDKRVVLPLHPEIFQAMLLQTLKKTEEVVKVCIRHDWQEALAHLYVKCCHIKNCQDTKHADASYKAHVQQTIMTSYRPGASPVCILEL